MKRKRSEVKTKNLQADLGINLLKEKSKKGSAKLIEDPSYISSDNEIVPTSENDEQPDSAENTELSEYEVRRLENIRKNQEMLSSLNIETAASLAMEKKKYSTPRLKLKLKHVEPVRRSPRISGKKAEVLELIDNIHVPTTREYEERCSGPVDAMPRNDVEDAESRTFLNSLDILSKNAKITASIVSEETSCIKSYKERISKLGVKINNVRKVIPSRITTMAFHPSCDKTIICAGDKTGNIGVWNVDETSTDNDEIFVYRPHTGNVRELCFHPTRDNDFMSCSADGSLRRADFNTCVFEEVYASDDHGINSFSYPCGSRETLLLAFTDGHVRILDTRVPPASKMSSHLCHTRAIKCLHFHPTNEYLFCTSSADASVAIWDLRKIKGMKSKLDHFEGHGRSVTSAYFSPVDGTYIVTTSWDDTVKVLEQTSDSKLKVRQNFRHFNHTNRWLSPFKATWDPRNGRGFVIGSMLADRRIQFYHAEQKAKGPLLEMLDENFTTIASTNVFHPTKNLIASGNSSGKVSMWSD